jgi:hypothetical protein
MKRRFAIILIVVLAVVIGIVMALYRRTNPGVVYQGQTAQYWLTQVFTTNQGTALKAFRTMSTNAAPVLVSDLEKHDGAWDHWYLSNYSKFPAIAQRHLVPPVRDVDLRQSAHLVLINNRNIRLPFADVVRILKARIPDSRSYVLMTVTAYLGPKDLDYIPILLECLGDADSGVRAHAASALSRIGPAAKAAVPVLENIINDAVVNVRSEAALALWRIDQQTNTAARVLREVANSPDPRVRGFARVHLSQVLPGDPSVIPLIVELLQDKDQGLQWSAVLALRKYGPAAREAVPFLINIMDGSDRNLRPLALESLKKIDPEVAAKYEKR